MSRDYLDEELGPPLLIGSDGIEYTPRRTRIRIYGATIEDDPVTEEKILRIQGLVDDDEIEIIVNGSAKLVVTEDLVDARTANTRVSAGESTRKLDTKVPAPIAAPESTNTTVFSYATAEDESVFISAVVMVATTDPGDKTIQEWRGWINNIAGTVTIDAEQASGNFAGDTSFIVGSIAGSTVNLVYNGPAGNLHPFIQLGAAPSAW